MRIAHRIINLSNFPICLREFSQIKNVKNLYFNSFNIIDNHPPIITPEDCDSFNKELNKIKTNHRDIPIQISTAVQEFKDFSKFDNYQLNIKLNEFYHARIGIRLLIDYYNFLFNNKLNNYLECNIEEIINSSFNNARDLCSRVYSKYIPNLIIKNEVSSNLLYIPSHLHYISFEIFKNAIRATLDANKSNPLELEIKETKNQIIFVFRDFGNSISHNEIKNLFNYNYTTVSDSDTRKKELIAGYGHGLPLSRLYSRFFGGNILFIPFHGIKSEVILYLNKNANTYEIEV